SGKIIGKHSLSTGVGPTVGDLVTDLNASPLSPYGVFSLDEKGALQLTPTNGSYSLVVANDGTSRSGTGVRLTDMLAAGDAWAVTQPGSAEMRKDLVADGGKLPMSPLDPDAPVGAPGVLSGDTRLANTLVDALTGLRDIPGVGRLALDKSVTEYVGKLSLEAARFDEGRADAEARHGDIMLRRESISGVNIDEELAQMIVYQN